MASCSRAAYSSRTNCVSAPPQTHASLKLLRRISVSNSSSAPSPNSGNWSFVAPYSLLNNRRKVCFLKRGCRPTPP